MIQGVRSGIVFAFSTAPLPQAEQKRAPAATEAPQLEQAAPWRAVPQLGQNFPVPESPQFGQVVSEEFMAATLIRFEEFARKYQLSRF